MLLSKSKPFQIAAIRLVIFFSGLIAIAGCGISPIADVTQTPLISPAAGTYTTIQTVTLTAPQAGAQIFYTTNGSFPTDFPTSVTTLYSVPITVAATQTINAIALAPGKTDSPAATAVFTINLPVAATPVFTPTAGTYNAVQTVTITDATPGAAIYFTTNGTAPTSASTLYSGPIAVSSAETISAIAIVQGYINSAVGSAAYTLTAATPVIAPSGGAYTSTQAVSIADATPGAVIHYTTNGSVPTASSTTYTGAITVMAGETINAIATATGFGNSAVASAAYTFIAATPVISPAGGTYTSAQAATIADSSSGAIIYYTTNGSTPTTSSALYSGPITVGSTETINAIAVVAGYSNSPVATATFTINLPTAATPAISPAGGTYTAAQTVTITDLTVGASIHYTTDGSVPSSSSPLYSGTIAVSASETISAIATESGYNNSAVSTAVFTLNVPLAATPVLSPSAGTYTTVQTVTIADSTVGAVIHFTTDGTVPTVSSPAYSAPITVAASETINAIATASGYNTSLVATASYVLNLPPAVTPVITPSPGTYTTVQLITISDSMTGSSIYYTTDGSTPTATSTLYSGAIRISSSMTIKAIATATGYNPSAVASAAYMVNLPTFTGIVESGNQLVSGATIQLYQIGTSGYTSRATPLLVSSVTSGVNGSFSLTGQYNSCAPGAYLYVTAAGGTPASAKAANPNLALMSVVGLCDNLTSNTTIALNEINTVAAAYSLAQFSKGTSFGTSLLSQPGSGSSAPADNFATSSTNLSGLANAMAVAQILANPGTGTAPGNNSNASALPEWWQVNLVANLLAACGNTAGGTAGDGTACGTLFAGVSPTNSLAPTDTIQAALDLALTPTVSSANIANLYGIIGTAFGSTAPFQPYATTVTSISDFSIAIEYQPVAGTTALLSQPSGIAIDSLGNAWVGNQPTTGTGSAPFQGFLVELTPTGVPIQAGATSGNSPSNFVINSYSLGGASTPFGGQYGLHNSSYQLDGFLLPAIDANNNVWIQDRQNSVMAFVTGSGTAYSKSLAYQNGGNALDSGGNGAIGHSLNAASYPASTAIDGTGTVWFQMTGATPNSACSALGTYTLGLGGFVGGDSSNAVTGGVHNKTNFSQSLFITIDPNINDTITSGGTTTEIPGAPFVWTMATNGNSLLLQNYSQPNGGTGITGQPCPTPTSYFTAGPNTAPGSTDPTAPGAGSTNIPDIPNPALAGDYLHYSTEVNTALGDQTWDKFGNMWIANEGQINTTTSSPIKASITKMTPNYGSSYTPAQAAANFSFSVIHGTAGLYDNSTDYPTYLTTDGAGNVWFSLVSNHFVNAVTNVGVALSPYVSGVISSTTAGFAGSVCTNCTFNGVKATYGRPALTINRPVIDLSGNVWVPVSGVGSTYVDLLVGIAAPKVAPDSLGLKNGTFGFQP